MPNESDADAQNPALDIVLDTCCLVNLAAIDGTLACLVAFDVIWYVPTAVQAEGVFIRSAADTNEVRRIDLDPAITAGLVHICTPADDVEQALYVEFALSLDDGEAMALAIAKNRNWKLATDDRKARNKARAVGVTIVTTPELLHRWAARAGPTDLQIAEALRRVETLARFTPSENSPAADWWRQKLATAPEA